MSSRALNTSDAEMLLCCLEVETSCALALSRQKNKHTESLRSVMRTYVAAAKHFHQQKKVDIDRKGQSIKLVARTKVIYKHRRALN